MLGSQSSTGKTGSIEFILAHSAVVCFLSLAPDTCLGITGWIASLWSPVVPVSGGIVPAEVDEVPLETQT